MVNQADVVGLLSVGSKAAPKEDVLQIGEAGQKQLVAVKQEGEERGLAALFEKDKKGIQGILGPNGLPPLPANLNPEPRYKLGAEQAYPEKYVSESLGLRARMNRELTIFSFLFPQISLPYLCLNIFSLSLSLIRSFLEEISLLCHHIGTSCASQSVILDFLSNGLPCHLDSVVWLCRFCVISCK